MRLAVSVFFVIGSASQAMAHTGRESALQASQHTCQSLHNQLEREQKLAIDIRSFVGLPLIIETYATPALAKEAGRGSLIESTQIDARDGSCQIGYRPTFDGLSER